MILVVARGHDILELSIMRFRKNEPLIFESDTDLLIAKEWIRNIERIF